MRVLYLTYGSQSNVIRFLSDALRRRGIEVDVVNVAQRVTYRNPGLKVPSLRPQNVLNACLAVRQFGRQWKKYFKRTDYAFRLMTEESERVLERRKGTYEVILQSGALFAASFRKPERPYCLYIDHTYALSRRYQPMPGLPSPARMSRRWEDMEAEVFLCADTIFTMSGFVRQSLLADYGAPEEKVVVAGAGPNLARLPDSVERKENLKTVLFVGKEFARKGGNILLDAFVRVRNRIPEARLIIAGAKKRDIPVANSSVEVVGPVRVEEMSRLYEKASVFALPTLQEPFGLVFLEAMAHGLPCVGTSVEAVPEIIEDGVTGFLVPAGDVRALEEKLCVLLERGRLADEMGERGRQRVLANFTWDIVAERMARRFSDLLAVQAGTSGKKREKCA